MIAAVGLAVSALRPHGLMLQINAVTRLKGVAIAEDLRSRDSISRKPSRAHQHECPQ